MILGTHNTMTYRKPKKFWMRLLKWTAKCQGVDYKTQHEKYGVNAFDLRVFWDTKGNIEFRHGMIAYDGSDFFDVIRYCTDNNITVRLFFEERCFKHLKKRSEKMELKDRFKRLGRLIETVYPTLKIYGGRNTDTWELVYKFKEGEKDEYEYYSSLTSLFNNNNKWLAKIDDICPKIYAKFKNRWIKETVIPAYEGKEGIFHMDFIEIQ